MPEKTVQIPSGVEVKREGREILVKGPAGELRRTFFHPNVKSEIKEGTVVFSSHRSR